MSETYTISYSDDSGRHDLDGVEFASTVRLLADADDGNVWDLKIEQEFDDE